MTWLNDDMMLYWFSASFRCEIFCIPQILCFVLHFYVFQSDHSSWNHCLIWSLQHHWHPSQDDLSLLLQSLAGQRWTLLMVLCSMKAINQGVQTIVPSALPLTARWLDRRSAGFATLCISSTSERWAGRPVPRCMIDTPPSPLQCFFCFLVSRLVIPIWLIDPNSFLFNLKAA